MEDCGLGPSIGLPAGFDPLGLTCYKAEFVALLQCHALPNRVGGQNLIIHSISRLNMDIH